MKLAELIKGKHAEIIKIEADSSIVAAAEMMTKNRIGALLVAGDGGKIAGILSERDIVRAASEQGTDMHQIKVSAFMTADLIRCAPGDSVNEAMAMMTDRHIRHLPVFDGDDLVGLISSRDLVKCRMLEVQNEAESLRQYILS